MMVSLRGSGSCHSAGAPLNYGQGSAHANVVHNGVAVAPHMGFQGSLGVPAGLQQATAAHMAVPARSMPVQNGSALPKHEPNSQLVPNLNCMVPSHHYRMLSQGHPFRYPRAQTPQRPECYHPAGAGYMSSGVGGPASNITQGGLRGVPPASQSPATTQNHAAQELNKQAMAHNFLPSQQSAQQQQQNRSQMFSSPYRTGATAARPTTHLRQPAHSAPLYQGSTGGGSTQMIYPMMYQPHGVIQPQYHSTQQRPGCFPQNVIIHQNAYCLPYQQSQPHQQYYYQTASPLLAPTNMTPPAPTGRNTTNLVASQGPPPAASGVPASSIQHTMPPQTHMHQNIAASRPPSVTQGQPLRKKRSFAITIKDPKTGEDVCADLYSQPSQPMSGESSERHTPQPETNSVAEEFSRMVIEKLTQETPSKPIFLSKSADLPQAASSALNAVQLQSSATNSSNNNNLKSDTLPLTENKILGADIAAESNETPIVSAISDSPVIVPKLCPTVIKVQKSADPNVSAVILDTNKNIPAKQHKQSRSKPVVPISDEDKLQSDMSASATAVSAVPSAPVQPSAPMQASAPAFSSMQMHISAHAHAPAHISMPTNVAAPTFVPAGAPSFVPAAAPSFTPVAYVPAPTASYATAPTPAYVPSPALAPAYISASPYIPAPAPTTPFVPIAATDLSSAHIAMPVQISTPVQIPAPDVSVPVETAAVPTPTPVPSMPTATPSPAVQMPPPQPQRPRKFSSDSRNIRRDSSPLSKEKVESSVATSNLNGPQILVTKSFPVEKSQEVSNTTKRFPTSVGTEAATHQRESSAVTETLGDDDVKKQEPKEESRPTQVIPTATELLAASIESVAARVSVEKEKDEDTIFTSASQAQAKLHQSLTSCSKNKVKETKEKEIMDADIDNVNTKSQLAAKLTNDSTKTDRTEKVEVHSTNIEDKVSSKIDKDYEVGGSNKTIERNQNETEAKIVEEQEIQLAPADDELDSKTDELKTTHLDMPTALDKPKLKYNYKDNQWSPLNTEGRKCYDRDFLLQLQDDPLSKKKPENIHMLAVVMKSKSPEGFVMPLNISRPNSESFLPTFAKSMPSKGPSRERDREPKKSSMLASKPSLKSSAGGGTGSSMGQNKNIIHVSLSLRSDVKLNESENAWKPTSRMKNSQLGEDEQTQELYKKFRGILNKLTPQKFDKLLDQVKHLDINSQARLEGVIDLIFEKAIDEPSFSVAYAAMCNKLSKLMVLADNSSDQYVNFRALIISKCQAQFEATKVQEGILKMERELADCTDAVRKKELIAMIVEENRKMRMRSVGNVRFIGELFKLKMLTSKIMLYCLNSLIDKFDEEKLECLCKLLTTIGQQLEGEVRPQLDAIFKNIQDIVERKFNKISSRVRFMLQDVIELRRRGWSSKNVTDAQPKTMDQIQKEAEHQQRQIEIMNSAPMGREFRREDGGRGKRGGEGRRAGANNFQDNWSGNSKRTQQYQVDTSKLKAATNKNLSNIKLGPPQHPWNHGSGAKPASQSAANSITLPTTTNNMYSALENVNTDPTSLRGSKEHTPSYHSKGASIERSTFNSKSDYSSGKSAPSAAARSSSSSRAAPADAPAPEPSGSGDALAPFTEQHRSVVRATIDLSLINPSDEEIVHEIKSKFKPAQHSSVVSEILNYALEKSSKTYPQIANSLLNLVSTNTVSRASFAAGLGEILEYAPDLHIDIPKLYDYLAFFVAPFILHKHIELFDLTASCEKIISENHGHLFLRSLLNELKNMMGPSYVRLKWEEVGLELKDWMNEEQALKFKEEKTNEFLFGESLPSDNAVQKLTPQETRQKLFHLMSIEQSCECIKGWIRDHIGKASSDEWFMRMLIQAVCEYALFGSNVRLAPRFNQERMTKYIHLINEYGDNKEARDANCLLGVQQLVHRLEHPKGVTLEIFQYLSDHYIIQREGFLAFEKSELEPEGKGVTMKALVSFFTSINEVDNEDSCSED